MGGTLEEIRWCTKRVKTDFLGMISQSDQNINIFKMFYNNNNAETSNQWLSQYTDMRFE